MKYLIDTSAWIEYLEGSIKGEKVNQILKEKNRLFILPIIITEVVSKVKKKKSNIETVYNAFGKLLISKCYNNLCSKNSEGKGSSL